MLHRLHEPVSAQQQRRRRCPQTSLLTLPAKHPLQSLQHSRVVHDQLLLAQLQLRVPLKHCVPAHRPTIRVGVQHHFCCQQLRTK
jgi:hypothetical protein